MKTASVALQDAIRKNTNVQAVPQLIAEWNMNRYYDTQVANTPSEDTDGYDIELFPIESVVEPLRPPQGIVKAIADQSVAVPPYTEAAPTARYYAGSVDDVYKYWVSPVASNATAPFDFPNDVDGFTKVRPQVSYGKYNADKTVFTPSNITMNKIVVGFETNIGGIPDWVEIWIRTSQAGAWALISVNPVMDADGRITIY